MSTLTAIGLCGICGARDVVEPALVAWVSPVFGKYEAIDRCIDRDRCRVRVMEAGESWPVVDPVKKEDSAA